MGLGRKRKRLFAMVKNEKGIGVKREERQLCGWVEGEKRRPRDGAWQVVKEMSVTQIWEAAPWGARCGVTWERTRQVRGRTRPSK